MKTMSILFISIFALATSAFAETLEERIKFLEEEIRKQQETLQKQEKMLEELKEQNRQVKTTAEQPQSGQATGRDYRLDDRSRGIYAQTASPVTPYELMKQPPPNLLNPAISLILDTFYYNSSLSQNELASRSSPGFRKSLDPDRQGFNLRSAELRIFAPVDPYFNLYATIPFTEERGTLEEAYFVTTALPAGFQIKGGKFRSGFGRLNAFHPHMWDFVDPPLPYKLFLGQEGLIEKGVQLTYLPNLPLYALFGIEILQGDNEILFGPDAQSGPHAYTGFAKASLDFGEDHTILFGFSVTGGKTKTASFENNTEFLGDSILYDGELTYKWKPANKHSFILQTEYLYLNQKGDLAAATTNSLQRFQDGCYVQALYQVERWRIGGRYDLMGLFKDELIRASQNINFPGRPYRWTGSLEYNPTEFSRIRLQYNYDQAAREGKENHEVFLQFILAVGSHRAHPF
jgi:hypothetical protein